MSKRRAASSGSGSSSSDDEGRNARLRRRKGALSYRDEEVHVDDFVLTEDESDTDEEKAAQGGNTSFQDAESARESEVSQGVGFTPWNVTLEEEAYLPPLADDAAYCLIRNHILTRWRSNVSRYLSLQDAGKAIQGKHRNLVDAAYKFLHYHGYINFGVSPELTRRMTENSQKGLGGSGRPGTVVVIGAGLAGLAAARQLMSFGHRVAVLEGRPRPGGRVYTKVMRGGGAPASGELGGSVITGTDGNPLAVLARQLKIKTHKIRDKCPLYDIGGVPVDEAPDKRVETVFNAILDDCNEYRDEMPEAAEQSSLDKAIETLLADRGGLRGPLERQLFDWHMANLEYANAARTTRLSLAHWDQDDPHEVLGDHVLLPGGNLRLVEALAEGVPIFYNHVVSEVEHPAGGAAVTCTTPQGERVVEADAVLCTLPLGVLKKGAVSFQPELPRRKREAIAALGFGLLNKVVMKFPTTFWDTGADTFGHLGADTAGRGHGFLFYSYNGISGGSVLIALLAGEAAEAAEGVEPPDAVHAVMDALRAIFEPKGVRVPAPLEAICTRWGSDPMAYGSYSSLDVGAAGDDYDVMEEQVGSRLFFGGEATTRKWPATLHGAFLSGTREAAKINAALDGLRAPPPADALALRPAGVQHVLRLSRQLAAVFVDPDEEFGCMSVVYPPQGVGPELEDTALLRVDVGGQVGGEGAPAQYCALRKPDVRTVQATEGGDEERLQVLQNRVGVRLVGRRGLGSKGEAVLSALVSAGRGGAAAAAASRAPPSLEHL